MPKRHEPCSSFPKSGTWVRVRSVLLIAFLFLVCASPVHAATVAVLRPSETSTELTEALFRLQGELLAVGLEVEVDARPAGFGFDTVETNAWFERMATERGLDAVIDLVGYPTPLGVDVWIFQSSSRRFRASRVMLEPNTPNAPETLAIRAIEVLRANFLVFDLADKVPREEPVPEPASEPPREESEAVSGFGVAAGATLLTSFDGVGPAILPLVRVNWAFYAGLAAEATFSGFGSRPSVETEAGSVRVAQDYGLVGFRYSVPHQAFLAAFVTLGAGASRTRLDGSANSPNQGQQVQQWAFLAEGSLGAQLELSRRYFLCLAGHVQWAAPYTAIHFVDTQVATTGHPNLAASLAVGAWL